MHGAIVEMLKRRHVILAATIMVTVATGALGDDDEPAFVATTTYFGVAFSDWCVSGGAVLDGCFGGTGEIQAMVVCSDNDCQLNGFALKDQFGEVACAAGTAASNMVAEGVGEGGCALIYFSNSVGVCQLEIWTDTFGGLNGETWFDIDTQAVVACASASL